MTWHPDIPNEYRNAIVTGDARELAQRIPDESVDLIFTDPPYLRGFLPLYGQLAQEAARVLKPGGFCFAMCGGVYLDEIMAMMSEHMTFFWKYEIGLGGPTAGVIWPFGNTAVPIITRTKPLLCYSKGRSLPPKATFGTFDSPGPDKRFHEWGQSESCARYYIECFTGSGDVVLDPFVGGGTTPAVCKTIGRNCIAFEIDPATAETARQRVAQTQVPWFVEQPTQLDLGVDA